MKNIFALITRQEKFRVIIWIAALVGITAATIPPLKSMYSDTASMGAMFSMLDSPAMVAMAGPLYYINNFELANLFTNQMLIFTILGAMFMNVFFIVRYTRADEERGNLELLLSRPISRRLPIVGTLIYTVLLNLAIAALLFLPVAFIDSADFTAVGALNYSLVIFASGLVAAGITAVFAQLYSTARSVTVLSSAAIGIFYIMRAAGDVAADNTPLRALSYISPEGLLLRTAPFVHNAIWPVAIVLVEAAVLGAVAIYLNSIRDYDQSFFQQKAGATSAGFALKSRTFGLPLGLVYRQNVGTIWGWIIASALCAASYGSIMGSMESFASNDLVMQLLGEASGDKSIVTAFIGMLVVVMTIVAAIPTMVIMLRLYKEEKQGRTDAVYVATISRTKYFISYYIVAMKTGVVSLLAALVTFGVASNMVLATPLDWADLTKTFLVYIPAVLLIQAVATFTVGCNVVPNVLAWAYFAFTFLDAYLGEMLKFPKWLSSLFGFSVTPKLFTEDMDWKPVMIMIGACVLLSIAGMIGYRQRDIKPQ
jgi:ABC-2 type transport system permease protein